MLKTVAVAVDAYIAGQPDTTHLTLRLVRNAIRQTLPQADEVISYGIPAFKLHGKVVVYVGDRDDRRQHSEAGREEARADDRKGALTRVHLRPARQCATPARYGYLTAGISVTWT